MGRKNKNHTKLLCSIGELSDLFEDSSSLEMFLGKIVHLISHHMVSEISSIYLFHEDNQELVLKATIGLAEESIGKVKLRLGEGLTGQALKEMRPICVRDASQNAHYKYFPGIGEEAYESFLAVPILRGQRRIGAVVVQNTQKNFFNEEDVRVLSAITSQLASTIETAKILMTIHSSAEDTRGREDFKDLKLMKGTVGSSGIVCAQSVVKEDFRKKHTQESIGRQKQWTLEDFQEAVRKTERELARLQDELDEKYFDVASLIFNAQILMVKDSDFTGSMTELILAGGNPPFVIDRVVRTYVDKFHKIQDPYIRERCQDIEDVGRRIVSHLVGAGESDHAYEGKIVIARELFPSEIIKLSSQGILGVILLTGGATSHLAILARSLKLPLMICGNPALLSLPGGTEVLMDAETGNIYVEPSSEVRKTFLAREKAKEKIPHSSFRGGNVTRDGTKVALFSNINLLSDVKISDEMQAEGIGLYRTEFPFIARADFPSEEEQCVVYRRLIESARGRPVTFRTLDIGGDKVLSYYDFGKEENPFLGMRSIRFSLRHKEIFSQQLRAILKAGAGTNVRVMFPMISSLDEFLEAKGLLQSCQQELAREGVPFCRNPQAGLMVELPSAVQIIPELAAQADFLSIGTNDLIQYMLAIDRTNEKVADLYIPYHPAVLRALDKITVAAKKCHKDISICGDMAHVEAYFPFLLGIGLRCFSVDPIYIPKIHALLPDISVQKAEKFAQKLLSCSQIHEILEIIRGNGKRLN